MNPGKALLVATGAYDCGKTTTLEWLRKHHNLRIHGEAHLRVLADLGDRKLGHAADQPFSPIAEPTHLCPMCRPRAFAELVLAEQRAIEARARDGDLLERGWIDPIEMYERRVGDEAEALPEGDSNYALVLCFEVMAQLQVPRWGKSVEQRVAEARWINQRLIDKYEAAGYEVVSIAAGSVQARAERVLEHLRRISHAPE